MAIACFKDLCIDASDAEAMGAFWARVLQQTWEPDDGRISGATDRHTVWIRTVPEAKAAKHRVHLDIYARDLSGLEAIGATVLRREGDARTWTVMSDPEGGEFCAFLREELPAERLHGLVVDCVDPFALADWWSEIFGATLVHDPRGFATLLDVGGMPILTMDFLPVPEPKTVKNRIHWDVLVDDLAALVSAGATILRPADDEIRWTVLADPEGNEFCAFLEPGEH
jgi:catechol 2,3-dioxygenase-like lactoylglutathione lyase family enzyme